MHFSHLHVFVNEALLYISSTFHAYVNGTLLYIFSSSCLCNWDFVIHFLFSISLLMGLCYICPLLFMPL